MTAAAVLPTAEEARHHPVLWALHASEGAFRPSRHLWWIADQLMKVYTGEITRLCVSIPPQHGKSWLISRFFPTWWLGQRPRDRILQCSYGHDLTVDWTAAGRDLLHEAGPRVFGVTTWARAKRHAWDLYDTRTRRKTGGGCRGIGKGGGATGKAVDLGLLDDVIKDRAEVQNAKLRQDAWEWLESAIFPRARKLIMIGTRWHHDDPIGRLEQKQAAGEMGEPWTFVNVPAVADSESDPLGRKPGEVLWPQNPMIPVGMDPVAWYAAKRREVGPYVWSALYQGRPTPLEGGMFRREWIRYWDQVGPDGIEGVARVPGWGEVRLDSLIRFATCDLATSTRTSADYTAIATWGYHPTWRVLLLLDMVRERIPGPELVHRIGSLVGFWRLGVVFVEQAGFQLSALAQISAAQQEGLPVRRINPEGDKVARALPMTAMLEGARLLFRRGAPWLPELERELLSFGPSGAEHDDQVDALAYGVLASRNMVRPPAHRSMRRREEGDRWLIGRD